jgi:hypothetical protein
MLLQLAAFKEAFFFLKWLFPQALVCYKSNKLVLFSVPSQQRMLLHYRAAPGSLQDQQSGSGAADSVGLLFPPLSLETSTDHQPEAEHVVDWGVSFRLLLPDNANFEDALLQPACDNSWADNIVRVLLAQAADSCKSSDTLISVLEKGRSSSQTLELDIKPWEFTIQH